MVLVANDKWWGAKPMTKRVTVWPQKADIQDRVNDKSADVVDVAAGSSGALATPDTYRRTDAASDGIEQLIFAPSGPLADIAARRAVASCTPRDVIARDAQTPIANARLHTTVDDAIGQAENIPEAGRFVKADPVAARAELKNKPLPVRIGYRGTQRAAGRHRRCDRQSLWPGRNHGLRRHVRLGRPAGTQGRQDRRVAGQHRRRHRQRFDRLVGDGRLRPAHR